MLFIPDWQKAILYQNWTVVAGNFQEFEYYAGIEAGNPSGTTDNMKSIKNFTASSELISTQIYEYDILDRVIKIIGQ
jgi:hypothetical protein